MKSRLMKRKTELKYLNRRKKISEKIYFQKSKVGRKDLLTEKSLAGPTRSKISKNGLNWKKKLFYTGVSQE
jgi:hypothetical protein